MITGNDRRRLGLVYPQPVTDSFLGVIGALLDPPATLVTAVIHFWGRCINIINSPARQTGTATYHTLQQPIGLYVNDQRQINGLAELVEQLIQGFGLRRITGKAVENKAFTRIRLHQPFAQYREHDFIRNQLAGIHHRLGGAAERGFCRHRRP